MRPRKVWLAGSKNIKESQVGLLCTKFHYRKALFLSIFLLLLQWAQIFFRSVTVCRER